MSNAKTGVDYLERAMGMAGQLRNICWVNKEPASIRYSVRYWAQILFCFLKFVFTDVEREGRWKIR
jgi:hypothetical protein